MQKMPKALKQGTISSAIVYVYYRIVCAILFTVGEVFKLGAEQLARYLSLCDALIIRQLV
jgi:hypothetical protein